jgi:hypothetical protein
MCYKEELVSMKRSLQHFLDEPKTNKSKVDDRILKNILNIDRYRKRLETSDEESLTDSSKDDKLEKSQREEKNLTAAKFNNS